MQFSQNSVDNPDQRLTEDLHLFATNTLTLFFRFFQSLLTLASFGYILWGLSGKLTIPIGNIHLTIPGYLCWAALLFAIIGTYVMGVMGKKLSSMHYKQQKYTADFRYRLIRLREASEQIALSRGEDAEKTKLNQSFSHIFNNFMSIIALERNLSFFTNCYSNVAGMIGILCSIPLYLAKKILLGSIMQISGAFGTVLGAFSLFIDSFYQLTEWRAVIHRLTELNQQLNSKSLSLQKQQIILQKTATKDVHINNLQLTSPSGDILLNNLNLIFKNSQATLISGASGLGKSTLLRALAGIWNYGSGTITLPQNSRSLFLSQKSYLPLGSLKDALIYPHNAPLSEEQLHEVLDKCLLSHFKEQLNTIDNWSTILSLGEQQLLACGRIFLYKPDLIFLDESTSALDEHKEGLIYENIKKYLPNALILSIGHRKSLAKFHDIQINLNKHNATHINLSENLFAIN